MSQTKLKKEQLENLTTADVAASTDKNYVTDAQATVIGNTSGTNTGDEDLSAVPTISSGAGAPSSTPTKVGDIYIDTTGDDAYVAVGTASSADWEKSNDGGGGGVTAETDGFSITAGTTPRTLTVTGGNITLTGGATSKGDLLVSDGTDYDALPVGTNDYVLVADSAEASGIKWAVNGAGVSDHGALTGLADDDHTQYSLITSQAGAPSSTPSRVGEVNIDTTADAAYIATGTASSADWTQVDGTGGGVTVSSGSGAPSSTPTSTSDQYIDTATNNRYFAFGTSSYADWRYVATTANPYTPAAADNMVFEDGTNSIVYEDGTNNVTFEA